MKTIKIYSGVLALLIACLVRSLTGASIRFSGKIFTYFLNDDVQAGKEIAVIQAKLQGRPFSPPNYAILPRKNLKYLKIDSNTGQIKLLVDLDKQFPLRKDDTRRFHFIVKSCSRFGRRRLCASVEVRIIALRENFGDKFVPDALKNVHTRQLINDIYKGVRKDNISPNFLLRVFRRVPKELEPRVMISAKQDMLIDYIRKKIVKVLSLSLTGNTNFDCLHLEKLFSVKALEKLLKTTTCKPIISSAVSCYRHINYRTYDGRCNNLAHPAYGASGSKLERMWEAEYTDPDGLNLPKGSPDEFFKSNLPSASYVGNYFIFSQKHSQSSKEPYSHMVMQWGQFLDHDMDHSPESEGADHCSQLPCDGSLKKTVPPCFPIVPPNKSIRCIMLTRSSTVCQADPADLQPREQINALTAYIDGSQVYGSSERVAKALRTGKDGLLRMSNTNLLITDPHTKKFPEKLCEDFGGCFLAGDARANEQMGLTSMHTLFNREHNRIATILKRINPHWNDDEKLYQEARKIVGAILQKITYEDYLPKIIGKDGILPFQSYRQDVNPGILNEFSTAAFRFAHSSIRPFFDVLDKGYNPLRRPIPLKEMFFNNLFIQKNGIEPILLGLLANSSQDTDPSLAEGLTKHLFERKNIPGLNLAALNIQRGRDHGLSGYNTYRKLCGLKSAKTFDDCSKEIRNAKYRQQLQKMYKTPDKVDLWVGGLAEDPVDGASVGPTFLCIISKQFANVRDGDRFFYEEKGVFTQAQLKEIKKVTLSQILCQNLNDIVSIQKDAFIAPTCKESRLSCERILEHSIDLNAWKELVPCYSNPCQHGGVCIPVNKRKNYRCLCPPYWTGKRCEYRQHICHPNPCLHSHLMWCRSEERSTKFTCSCYFKDCYRSDFCRTSPCPSGYQCSKHHEGYKCTMVTNTKLFVH